MELAKLPSFWTTASEVKQKKFVSQALYQTLQTIKVNFEKLLA